MCEKHMEIENIYAHTVKKTIDFTLGIEVDDEMAELIDELVEENIDNLVEKLEDEGAYFLQSAKEMLEQRQQHSHNNDGNSNNAEPQSDGDGEEEEDYQFSDEDEDWVQQTKQRKASRAAKRKNVAKNTNLDGSKRCGRLLLNDALLNVNNQEGWSDARKKAWANRKTQQNGYFYRFNVPGQPQKNGKWTDAEHELFMKRVLEIGVNDQWGIFSKKIPGRVGYQCSNYWRGLVKDGDVTDPNYHFDGKKLHFKRHTKHFSISPEYRKFAVTINKDASKVFTDLPAKHPKHPSDAYCREVEQALAGQYKDGEEVEKKSKKKTNKRKRKNENDEDGDGDDEEWSASKPSSKRRKRARRKKRNHDDDDEENDDDDNDASFYCKTDTTSNYDQNDEDEIEELKDFIDIMTGMKVQKPAISPHGHVLGYDTWTKILRTSKCKDQCPFTLQRMTRRSLIKLTKENYAQYKDKIINITQEQMQLMADINKDD